MKQLFFSEDFFKKNQRETTSLDAQTKKIQGRREKVRHRKHEKR